MLEEKAVLSLQMIRILLKEEVIAQELISMLLSVTDASLPKMPQVSKLNRS